MLRPLLRRPRAVVVAGLWILAALLACPGCSHRPSAAFLRPAPQAVGVSIVGLATTSSEWSSLSQLDQVIAQSVRQPQPVPLMVAPDIAPLSEPYPPAFRTDFKMSTVRREASIRAASGLTMAADRAVAAVRARLDRNQARLRIIAQALAAKRVSAGLVDAKDQATRDYLARLPALMQSSAARRANLKVQIEALGVDSSPANPPNAPPDHWDTLLAQRKAELAHLNASQLEAERQAEVEMAAQVESARESLQRAADAQLAAYDATLDARRAHVLARQHDALQKEQSELTSVSAELDRELNQPLESSAGSAVLNARTSNIVAGGPIGAASPAAVFNLRMQRQRLEQTLLDTTKRRALRAADELNLKIIDWNSRKPDTKAMAALSKQMSRDVTG